MAKNPRSTVSPMPLKQNQRMEVRPIQNGYIVTKSGTDSRGNYKHEEVYSKTNPVKITTK